MPATLKRKFSNKTKKEIRNETNRLLAYLGANKKMQNLLSTEHRLKKALMKPTLEENKKRGNT